ncbi:MAG: hypothetical protein M1556_01305 [Candidatus Thermoplasmatota archaeon]|nr:hypothetical protein [Candidatus Thermoplasmatota archaeon]
MNMELLVLVAAVIAAVVFFFWRIRYSQSHRRNRDLRKNRLERRSVDMGASPEGEYYKEINWLAIFVFAVIVILVLNVAFLYPTIVPGAFYYGELLISGFLWQRMTFLPLWIGLIILLLAWGPGTLWKPVLVFEGKNHWYYKVRGPDRGLISFYLIRNLGKQPVTVYKAYVRKKGLSYYIEASDLIIEPGRRPSLIVVEGLGTGEVREILALQKENRDLKIYSQKLERELRIRYAPSIELIQDTLRLTRGGTSDESSKGKK